MAIEASEFIVLEDGLRTKSYGVNITSGQPVSLNSLGQLVPATATSEVYGICKLDSNQFNDFAFGEFGAFGSGQLTVVLQGILLLAQSIYNEIEVTTQTTTSLAPTTIKVYDDTQSYNVNDALYVDSMGLISNVNTAGKQSLLGRVVSTPAQNGGFLEVEVNCTMPTTTASQLA
jgi:hypothetical protein